MSSFIAGQRGVMIRKAIRTLERHTNLSPSSIAAIECAVEDRSRRLVDIPAAADCVESWEHNCTGTAGQILEMRDLEQATGDES